MIHFDAFSRGDGKVHKVTVIFEPEGRKRYLLVQRLFMRQGKQALAFDPNAEEKDTVENVG